MLRREFAGGVLKTQLTANISNSATSITVIDGSTFPTGANNPFVIVIGRGTAQEKFPPTPYPAVIAEVQ